MTLVTNPNHRCVLIICLTYAVIAPLIAPVALLYFCSINIM